MRVPSPGRMLTGACSPLLVWKATMQYSTDLRQENTVCRRLRNLPTSLSLGPVASVRRSTENMAS